MNRLPLALSAALFWCLPLAAQDEVPTGTEAMDKLKAVQELVGDWEGNGRSKDSRGWDENVKCAWKFQDDAASLHLAFEPGRKDKGRLLDEGVLTWSDGKYVFKARKVGTKGEDGLLVFEGKAESDTNLVLERVKKGKADDDLDQLDVKILNKGDRIVYSFKRRIGRSSHYREYATVGLDREGQSIAAAGSSGPKCIVTGGAGTMTVSHDGKTYHVCCSGCKAQFEDNPEKFIALAEKRK